MDVVIKEITLDGKKVSYTNQTEFLVQVGKGKGSYRTKYQIFGNLHQAVAWYKGINIGNGYKKRLLMPACEKNPVLAREVS
jgi:hypothetical protein